MTDLHHAVAALARLSLSEHSLESLMREVCRLVLEVVPGADEASVTIVDGDHAWTAAFEGDAALALDERQYSLGHGPCVDGSISGTQTHIPDMATEERWPKYTPVALEHGIHSSIGVPIPAQRDVVAAINVYSRRPHAFDARALDTAQQLASYVGIALGNLGSIVSAQDQAESLQTMMRTRAVIEQAKGILMGDRRIGADAAFDVLVAMAQGAGRSLRDEAQELVDRAGGG